MTISLPALACDEGQLDVPREGRRKIQRPSVRGPSKRLLETRAREHRVDRAEVGRAGRGNKTVPGLSRGPRNRLNGLFQSHCSGQQCPEAFLPPSGRDTVGEGEPSLRAQGPAQTRHRFRLFVRYPQNISGQPGEERRHLRKELCLSLGYVVCMTCTGFLDLCKLVMFQV